MTLMTLVLQTMVLTNLLRHVPWGNPMLHMIPMLDMIPMLHMKAALDLILLKICLSKLCLSSPGLRPGSFRFHVNDGFYYHRQRVAGGRAFLRCVNSRSSIPCPVRAVMNEDLSNFYVTNGEHNHGPDEFHDRVQQLRSSLLQACRARPNVRVDVIYHEVCRKDVSSRVSLCSVRPSMVRAQADHRPNIPQNFDELHDILSNNIELRQTMDGQDLLYQGMSGREGHRSILFMSRRVVDGMGPINYLFCDATFYSRPNSPASSQLFTIVTTRDNHVLPLVHALMESRTEGAYRDLLVMVRQLAPYLDPDFLITDFEAALQRALRFVFPRARLTGCLWHYARAVCRNVRTLGLHELVRDVENARRLVRLSLAIPLAPANRLQEALNCLVIEARRVCLMNKFEPFIHYIRTTWIVGVGPQSLSVFGVRYRCNNAAECRHRNINARLVRRPNIWRFLEIITEMEDVAWRDLARIEIGLAPSRARRTSSILNDARVRSLSRQIMHGEMNMLAFLSGLSWHLDNTMRDMLVEREGAERPASPDRCPALLIEDDSGSALQNVDGVRPNSMCPDSDADFQSHVFEPLSAGGVNRYSQLNDSNLFEDLVEEYENVPPAGRGRGIRGRRGRGRPSSAGGRGRGRGRPAPRVLAPSWELSRVPPPRVPAPRVPAPRVPPPPAPPGPPAPPLPHVPQQPRHLQELSSSIRFRSEDFSDEEYLPDGDEDPERRWQECLICFSRVGHYMILGCGAFPICGHCVRQWFVRQRQRFCPHCGSPTPGWLRLRFD